MERTSLAFLRKWLSSSTRRPLVLRGARQVGKTWLVRRLAEIEGKNLIEVNLERTPTLSQYFESNNPKEIIEKLSIRLGVPINPDQSILFIDEIQEKPALYGKLRWFAEDMPELPVIAAGSLLEFIFKDEEIRIPVGRIGYMYLEPLSFIEFLQAYGRKGLVGEIRQYSWDKEIHSDIHEEIMKHVKEYLYVGGMPQAVQSWITERSLEDLNYIKNSIIASYREDFKKYGSRIAPEVLDKVLEAIPRELGQKFVYSRVDEFMRHETVKKAFNLLCKARVTHSVIRTSANGVPLGAESHENFYKALLLDVGLCSSLLRLTLNQLTDIKEIDLINKGAIAEQVVGQLIRTIDPPYIEPQLYYWVRPQAGSSAEIDYIISHNATVIPIEVKAGTGGSLKSLHVFMEEKGFKTAVRIDSGLPQKTVVKVKSIKHDAEISYDLLSMPFYLMSELHRLIEEAG